MIGLLETTTILVIVILSSVPISAVSRYVPCSVALNSLLDKSVVSPSVFITL